MPLRSKRNPNRKSPIVNCRSLQAQSLNGAGVDTGPAIDAGIRVHRGLALDHADRVAGAFPDTGLTSGALILVNYCRHPATLSKERLQITAKARNHNALRRNYNRKIFEIRLRGFRGTRRPSCRRPQPDRYGFYGSLGLRVPLGLATRCETARTDPGGGSDAAPRQRKDLAGFDVVVGPDEVPPAPASSKAAAIPRTRSLASFRATQSRTLSNPPP